MNALLRVLIPSWRFFDDVGHVSKLYYQIGPYGPWQPCFQPQQRHWYQLFLNPHTNLRMALNSIVERLSMEISDLDENKISESITYQLVENLVRHQVKSIEPKAQNFRFKIVVSSPVSNEADYNALISKEHGV